VYNVRVLHQFIGGALWVFVALPGLSPKAAVSPGLWNQRGCSLMAF
jgi:hypothetical protein